jgi:hypothetical protein
MKYILYLGIVIYLYVSNSVAAVIGINQVGTFSSLMLVGVFLVIFLLDVRYKLMLKFKQEFYIILVAILLIAIKILLHQFDQINSVLFFFIVPMMLSITLGQQNDTTRSVVRNIILFFLFTECSLALFENLNSVNIFPYAEPNKYVTITKWNFRSTAFLGHPLGNALCVSVIMGFIAISKLKAKYKIFFMILGYIALLCFNARSAILIWSGLALIYLIKVLKDKNTGKIASLLLILFLCLAPFVVFYLATNYGIGGRLVKSEIVDGSAQTRLDVYKAFSYIDTTDFLTGNSENYLPITKKLGAAGIENSYIVLIVNYGLIMFLVILFLYYLLMNKLLKRHNLFNKFIIIVSFIVVGSTNNSLAGSTPWTVFIMCLYSFPAQDIIKVKNRNRFYYQKRRTIYVPE